MRKHSSRRDPVLRARLALRNIEGNLCFTDHEAWAWYSLPTQPWAFRSDTLREQLLYGAGDALAWLAGHRVHLRVTTRPYPADEWARELDRITAAPLKTHAGGSWGDHLVAMQGHLRHQTMAEKKVFLGVRLAFRAPSHRLIASVWRRPGNIEHARLLSQVERVTETVGLPGMDGRPVTSAEMEWLLRRSVGIGLPAPGNLSPVQATGSAEIWDGDDLHTFTDDVDHVAAPFGRTVTVVGHGATSRIE